MKSILITGGSGSFGQAFTRYLLDHTDLERIVIYSRGEHTQEEMARAFNHDERLRFFIGDVRDLSRLELALNGIDTIVHAAALKIVPTAEYNPTECVATNVRGTENVVKAALRVGVEQVVGLSTDKAVNPINLYGATKLTAEKILIGANALSAGRTRFNIVRYGNVSHSRGSVIPLFKKLKAEGRPLPVTDERMTRFIITMDQAIKMVCATLSLKNSARILVPKIPSARLTDIALAIDDGANNIIYNTGIRPGEKLHETLIMLDEGAKTESYNDHFYIIHKTPIESASRVREGFQYTSDANDHWLSQDEIKRLVS